MIGKLLVLSWLVLLGACAARTAGLEVPAESARHRAALATVTVVNETAAQLAIYYRTAVPPVQETLIGRVAGGARTAMAPLPAGEPVILIARRADGAEYQAPVQSFPLDGSVEWRIPKDATFLLRESGQ